MRDKWDGNITHLLDKLNLSYFWSTNVFIIGMKQILERKFSTEVLEENKKEPKSSIEYAVEKF
jgi:hypothetical protein